MSNRTLVSKSQDWRRIRSPFRSANEAQIAGLLEHQGIIYLYEHPVVVVDQGKSRLWYPDFQLPQYGVIIEYCGMPEVPEYFAGMKKKDQVYRDNGLTALLVTPDDMKGFWPGRLFGQIEAILRDRLDSFLERTSRTIG